MDKKYFLIPILAVIIIGVFALGYSQNDSPSNDVGGVISYHSSICKTVTRADGTIEPTMCSHNVLYNTGKDEIETYLADGLGAGDAFDWIELGNASADSGTPQADKSEAYTPYGAVCGLDTVAGTVDANPGNGNWSVHHEFTSTCDGVNMTMVRFTNAAGDDLSGNDFTIVTLQNLDKILINGTFWVQ